MKRVLLTGDTAGGVWTFVLDLADGLLARGLDVCLATFGPSPSEAQCHSAAKIEGLNWHHHTSRLEWMEDPWEDIRRAGEWLVNLRRQESPDLVHLNTLCHGALFRDVPLVTTVHSCVLSWWAAVKQSELPATWDCYWQRVEESLANANTITAPSSAMLDSVRQSYAIECGNAKVVPNGRNSESFHFSEKQPLIFSVGRLWDEGKNIEILARTARHLPWPIYLAGDAGQTTFENCTLLGQLSTGQLSNWYAQSSIYVAPAKYEPFGLAILEAAMSGCALVLSDIPSLRETWGDAALYFAPEDANALEHSLRLLIDDPQYRHRMSGRALARSKYFSQSRMVDSFISIYARRCACAS